MPKLNKASAPSNRKERTCGYAGCVDEGTYRAPKSRYHLEAGINDWYWFCLAHIRDYNARWNYYNNMSEAEIELERRADATWQRPSWPLGTGFESSQKIGYKSKAQVNYSDRFFEDPFNLFAYSFSSPFSQEFPPSSPQAKALKLLQLSFPFSKLELQKRYRELVKKYHPDINGSSLEAENAIKHINEAYHMLKEWIPLKTP